MKIKELVIGELVDITLVVKSATARETKAKKPYLAIEFFDGVDTINANYWDWVTGNVPAVNTILDVKANVTEWQGNKQLNVKSMKTNTEANLYDFAPKSDFNLEETYAAVCALLNEVSDETLRTLGVAIFTELKQRWLTVPGAISVHHNFVGGTLVHSHSVARIAKAIAEQMPQANVDLVVVGALLHDLGKLFTYKMQGVVIDMTNDGQLYDHVFIGAEFIGNFAESHVDTEEPGVYHKVRLLRHILLAHHGELEFGSPVTPRCLEAYIVHYADALDATGEQLRKASADAPEKPWTDKVWTLHNRPHLTCQSVAEIMSL